MDKLSEITHGAKVVLGASIAFLIISIFNWQEVDLGPIGSAGISMWHGVGVIAGLLAIAIIAWQAVRLANINLEVGVTPSMVTAALAVLLLLFTIIKFFADSEFRTFWAWLGLILAIVVCVGAWMNMKAVGESLGDVRDKVASMTASSSEPAAAPAAPAAPVAPTAPAAPAAPIAPEAPSVAAPEMPTAADAVDTAAPEVEAAEAPSVEAEPTDDNRQA